MSRKNVLRGYLNRYAEAHCSAVAGMPGHYHRAVVLPAFDESADLLDAFAPVADAQPGTLLILVANAPDTLNAASTAVTRTATLANRLATRYRAVWRGVHGLSLHPAGQASAWLLVDCFSDGRRLPHRHGVGLARKIGSDIACALYAAGSLADAWFCSTDADTLPPANLTGFAADDKASAHTLAFGHRWEGERRTRIAGRLYDFYLHYHVWGLATAQSPYAHYSIGSTLVLNAQRYAQVRGFPRRAAGEDFHLLAKLAKLAPVTALDGPHITVRARLSQRVPFGTGPALATIAALENPIVQYRLTHPGCFTLLSQVLEAVSDLFRIATDDLPGYLTEQLPTAEGRLAATLLEQAGAIEAVATARRQAGSRRRFLRHFHTWFDALKTQQFLHGLVAGGPGSVSLPELLSQELAPALAVMECESEAQLDAVCAAMSRCCRSELTRRMTRQQVFATEPPLQTED